MDVKEVINNAPEASGVYLMKDKTGNIIYIGKAYSLKKRISSYFLKTAALDVKAAQLVGNINAIDYIKTQNEAAALILENSLIKKYQPKYNIALKDDKSYPAIIITNELFPRVFIGRPYKQTGNFKYYGPYPDAALLKEAFKILRRIFKFRSCKTLPKKPCLYSKLNLCYAPCLPLDKQAKAGYRRICNNISLFLEGRYEDLINDLTKKMFNAAKRKSFEEAKESRDEISALSSLFSLEDKAEDELIALKKILNLKKAPIRIEAFDISSAAGDFKVGSLVSFYKGMPDKSNYRRFKIKTVQGIDDYSCLREVLLRRFSRLAREKLSLPDLILIDGGKGHLAAAVSVLQELNLSVSASSIAKENEIIFTPKNLEGIILSKDSSALKLIQRIRDEAHRFAHNYHVLLRKKHLLGK